jgi:hypothetical protein
MCVRARVGPPPVYSLMTCITWLEIAALRGPMETSSE